MESQLRKGFEIREASVDEIVGVRHRVLRKGRPIASAHFPQDQLPETFHLALIQTALPHETVVGSVSLCHLEWHDGNGNAHIGNGVWQLRGMAVDDHFRGRGYGTWLVQIALTRLREAGATMVWCDSRVRAQSLYRRCGFVASGDIFDIASVGPHIHMALDLG